MLSAVISPSQKTRSDQLTLDFTPGLTDRFTNLRERILAALKKHGPRTAHELERITGLSVVQIDRRMHELVKCGQARAHVDLLGLSVKRGTPSGGIAQVWEAA